MASAMGGYSGVGSGAAESIAVSYVAPDVLCDKTTRDAGY